VSYALGDSTWPEMEAVGEVALLVVPIGSTEQHGPHLPLSTDTDIAEALASAFARQRANVQIAPTVPYGSSGEHSDFAGTLSIGRETTERLLVELGRSASNSFKQMLWISTHGGNREPVEQAERQLRSEGRNVRAFFPSWPGDSHAGRVETSLSLAIDAQRVRMELASAGATAPLQELMPRLRDGQLRAVSPNGVLGDATGSSSEEGHGLLEQTTGQLLAFVTAWLDG
jgi:mycofactocin system creatininase family protein